MGHDTEANKGISTGVQCSKSRLWIVACCLAVVFTGAILITYFTTKNNYETDNWEWPDSWGSKDPVTFDDWYSGVVSYSGYAVTWIEGEDAYLITESGNLNKYSAPNYDNAEELVAYDVFDEAGSSTYYRSSDLRYLLFALNRKSKWRYSYDASYKIYDTTAENFIEFPGDSTYKNKELEIARWSNKNSLAFVYKNNLYYQATPESTSVDAISTEGSVENHIFVGHSDWAYEEELLYTNQAFWFSPDSKYLAYGIFDESHLPIQEYPYYGPDLDVYGETVHIAYPKPALNASDATSKIQIKIWNTDTKSSVAVSPPSSLASQEHYVTTVTWRDDTHVAIVWVDRLQDEAIFTICDATTGTCVDNYKYNEPGGWVDPEPAIQFMNNGQQYVNILPKDEGASGNWRHVALHDSPTSGGEQPATFLTSGANREVSSIVRVDQARHLIYYYSYENNGNDLQLYRVGTSNAAVALQADTCITCDMNCDYVSVSFSSTANDLLFSCRGKGVPWYELLRASDDSFSRIKSLEDNSDYKQRIKNKAMPTQQWKRVPVGGGHTAEVMLWLPPNYDEGSDLRHPLFVNVYAGPGSQYVTNTWSTGWQTYLSSMEGVIYARIDGRGAKARGDKNRFTLKRALGTVEIEDQILAAKWLTENMNIDKEKVAIWGSSYGGFSTLHTLADSRDVYKCGISQSPVTDFRYYDAPYTERFMDKASEGDNQAGYERTNMLDKVNDLADKKLLLTHGTADDNVHFLHATHLMKALNRENIDYRTVVKPDDNHYTMGTRHLYRRYTDFLIQHCFGHDKKDKQQ